VDVRVHGRNLHIGDELRRHAERKVGRTARFFDQVTEADVEIVDSEGQNGDRFTVRVTTLAAGQDVRVEASGATAFAAVDVAADKFGKSIRRVHDRLVHRSRKGKKDLNLTSAFAEEERDSDGADIVRVKQFVMKPMTPEDAALQMEQLGHNFFFFLSAETGYQSVLYRRRDGRLGLIEPA
jgi:putative sigma-54 modulation protein